MVQVKSPVVDRILPKSNNFATGVGNRATGNLKRNGSPALALSQFTTMKSQNAIKVHSQFDFTILWGYIVVNKVIIMAENGIFCKLPCYCYH